MVYKTIAQKVQLLLVIAIFTALAMNYSSAQDGEDDTDNDGMPDDWEQIHYLDSNNSSDAAEDNDTDGLSNLQEYDNNTDPNNPDTDGDGMTDGWEVENYLDPLDESDANTDADDDSHTNLAEFINKTNPRDKNDPIPMHPDDGDGVDPDEKEEAGMYSSSNSFLCIIIFAVAIVVVLLVIIFVYTKMRREQLLEHQVRSNIYTYINTHPGVHYRGIMSDLHLQLGVLTHHVNMLEQQQYIKSVQDGMYRRFYPINAQVKSGLILSDVQERILRAIQSTPGASQAGLAKNLGLARKVVNYHIKILSDAGFVHVEQNGRESRCFYIEGLDMAKSMSDEDSPAG